MNEGNFEIRRLWLLYEVNSMIKNDIRETRNKMESLFNNFDFDETEQENVYSVLDRMENECNRELFSLREDIISSYSLTRELIRLSRNCILL